MDDTTAFSRAMAAWAAGALLEAARLFREAAALGEPGDEVWYSLYTLARIRHQTEPGDLAHVAQGYAQAYDFDPTRLEPVAHLARLYREAGHIQTVYEIAGLVLVTPMPDAAALGLEPQVYQLLLPIELLSACRALGREEEARVVLHRILSVPRLPLDLAEAIVSGALDPGAARGPLPRGPGLGTVVPGWWEA